MTTEKHWPCRGDDCRAGEYERGFVIHLDHRIPVYDVFVPNGWIDEAIKHGSRYGPPATYRAGAAENIAIGLRCGSYTPPGAVRYPVARKATYVSAGGSDYDHEAVM